MVEDEGFLTLVYEFLIEDVEHLQETGVIGDVVHLLLLEVTGVLGTVLLPVSNCK